MQRGNERAHRSCIVVAQDRGSCKAFIARSETPRQMVRTLGIPGISPHFPGRELGAIRSGTQHQSAPLPGRVDTLLPSVDPPTSVAQQTQR
ncbi:hypothetical protein CSAL01_05223 [Colletotrichum salicis]|uniref:Uncharacterized protein n=1 Tax=Colletotrichum salicis TaxID=1209931 RepID=A0A135UP02_9PEZI|nr:hypothetical protein CSAL01_05223 [Colletotrichum salicis]